MQTESYALQHMHNNLFYILCVFVVFEEDGETYILVLKRKIKPPSVDKSTQTSPYKRKDNSQIDIESSLTCSSSPVSENTTIDVYISNVSPVEYHSHSNEAVENDEEDEGLHMHCISPDRRTSNPIIVIETVSN